MEEVELANWLKQAMVWGNGHCARSPWRIVWELWFGFQAPWALMISCLLSGWGVLYIHSRANLNLGGRWWISTRWTWTLSAHNRSNYLTKCVYVWLIDFRCFLWLCWWLSRWTSWALLPYPLPHHDSSLFGLHPSNLIALEGVSVWIYHFIHYFKIYSSSTESVIPHVLNQYY